MTRRKIYFFDSRSKKLYATPEFNGDKNEFEFFRKRGDSCDKNFEEILKEFDNIKTLEEFSNASNKAQSYYHSGFGIDSILPIEEISEITYNDEIYIIDNEGKPYLYNQQELKREHILNMCNKGKFIFKDFTMSITKTKHSEKNYDIYILNIEPIENIYSGLELYLGDFSNDEKNQYWGSEFNENLNATIRKLEECKQNLNKEPVKIELVDLLSEEYKYCFKDENGKMYGVSNGGDCIFLTTINNNGQEEGSIYDFKAPIKWEDKNIYSIFLESHNDIGYEIKHFNIPRIKMAYKINSYIAKKEDILYSDTINKNLNDIYADIYNIDSIEKNFFKKYENEIDIKELRNEYYELLNDTMGINIEMEEEEIEI